MTEQTTDTEYTERRGEHSLAGGGEFTYRIKHRRDEPADRFEYQLGTLVEQQKARYFNHAPRSTPYTRRADTEHELAAIREAVEAINDSPTFGENTEGDVEYRIEEGYYPGEWTHYVDLSNVEHSGRGSAMLHAQSELCSRGYVVNSIRVDEGGVVTNLHVVSLRWVYDARSHGLQQEREGHAE